MVWLSFTVCGRGGLKQFLHKVVLFFTLIEPSTRVYYFLWLSLRMTPEQVAAYMHVRVGDAPPGQPPAPSREGSAARWLPHCCDPNKVQKAGVQPERTRASQTH